MKTEKELETEKKAATVAGEKAKVEAVKVNKERLSKLTFDERVGELRDLGYGVGQGEAAGLSDGVSAKTTLSGELVSGAVLTVVKDGTKYNVALDLLDKELWGLQADEVGEILGVEFDTEDFAAISPNAQLVKEAVSAANKAGGTFTPGKEGAAPVVAGRSIPSGVSPITTRGRGY